MVRSIDDLPKLKSVTHVDQSSCGVTRTMLEQTNIEVGKHSVSVVNTKSALRHDDSLVCKLKSRDLVVEAVEQVRQGVVGLGYLRVQNTVDLLVELERFQKQFLS